MGEFFHGWKRKVGCVTLMMACVLATLWMRSFVATDSFQWDLKEFGFGVISMDNSIVVILGTLDEKFEWTFPEVASGDRSTIESQSQNVSWLLKIVGLQFGTITSSSPPSILCITVIADLWIVPPLTAISAWLLLSKSRTKIESPVTPACENA